jgi:hypothetical protein
MVDEWKIDATINETQLSQEITRTPMLHAKYLEIYMYAKAKLISAEKKFNTTKWIKRKYFRGELEKHELVERGWSQWGGLKPSNSELNDLFESDRDLNELDEKVKYYKSFVSGVEFVLKNISQRDWGIKTLLEHQKFMAGAG